MTPLQSKRRTAKRLYPTLLGALLALVHAHVGAAPPAASEDAVTAAYVYNFIKFTDWPEGALPGPSTPMTLCTDATGGLREALDELDGKPAKDMSLRVADVPAQGLDGCHVAFIDRPGNAHLLNTRSAVLTIHNLEGGPAGGVIRLFREGNKLRFSINLAAARATSIKLSAKLIGVAAGVIDDEGHTQP